MRTVSSSFKRFFHKMLQNSPSYAHKNLVYIFMNFAKWSNRINNNHWGAESAKLVTDGQWISLRTFDSRKLRTFEWTCGLALSLSLCMSLTPHSGLWLSTFWIIELSSSSSQAHFNVDSLFNSCLNFHF